MKSSTGGRRTAARTTSRRTATTGRRRPASARPRPLKRLGQHYLAPAWAARVVQAIAPQPGDVFLEVGPGAGALTLPLAASGAAILAVEIDRRLIADLLPRVPPNVTILSGDILALDVVPYLTGLEPQRGPEAGASPPPPRRLRVAGNLPYYIASPILFRLLTLERQDACFADATVMVQREVADRLLARPGTKAYGALTILVGLQAEVTRLLEIPPGAFVPAPEVRSTVVRLTFRPPRVPVADWALLERLVKALFSQRRKTLANALKRFDPTGPAVLELAGLDGRRRPETLTLDEIARLTQRLASTRGSAVL